MNLNELINKYEEIIRHFENSQAQRFNHTVQMKINIFKILLKDLHQFKEQQLDLTKEEILLIINNIEYANSYYPNTDEPEFKDNIIISKLKKSIGE